MSGAENNYWTRAGSGRLSRRRALISAAGLTGAAALIAACGGAETGKGNANEGRLVKPKDTSGEAKRGGIFQDSLAGDENNLDALSTGRSVGGTWSILGYSRPLTEKATPSGTGIPEYIGDLAESWEVADGGLRFTVKLRADAKWDARAPTSSRPVDADDATFSWEKYSTQSPFAAQLSYKKDTSAPIESVQKIDARTYVYKSAFVWGPLIPSLARGMSWILPRESGDRFNARTDVRGSGPWMLDKYETSVAFNWKPNPNWYRKDVPYLDGIKQVILPEYATVLAQFRAGNLWDGGAAASTDGRPRVKGEDVIPIMKDLPRVGIYRGERTNLTPAVMFNTAPGSAFLDVRVRRAFSMAIDRQLLAEVQTGAAAYQAEGIPLDIALNSHIGAGWGSYWLDPKGKEIGEGGKYFSHDVAEAKKLLSAAGRDKMNIRTVFTTQYIEEKYASTIAQMLAEAGVQSKLEVVDYQTVMLGQILYSKGNFDGDMTFTSGGAGVDPASTLFRIWHTGGSSSRANLHDTEGKQIDATIEKAMQELDQERYKSLIWDAQRQLASHLPALSYSYSSSPFNPVWPWVMNSNVFRYSTGNTGYLNLWYDESKKT